MYKYIDIHSHLNDPRFDADLPDVLLRMREGGVASIVVGTDRTMSERAITLAEQNPDLWATIGLHPTDNHKEAFDDAAYAKMAAHPRVVAIGECGLDYFRLETGGVSLAVKGDSSDLLTEKQRQYELFERQVDIAASVDKPLMIHGRPSKGTMDAYEDILHILQNSKKRYGRKVRGNVHFFVGNIDIAKQFLDLGFTMSFTGVLTFTHDYDEVVRFIPPDMMHAETDAPYVAPTPHRGKRNEPVYVIETTRAIARIRGEEEERVAHTLVTNARRVFMPSLK